MFDAEAALTALGIPIVLDELIARRRIPPVVVLLVGNANRGKELSANPTFADLVALDLVPWVRRSYHTTHDRRLTVVAGVSPGGLAAAFSTARHPAVYGNVLSQSGSHWWGREDVDEGEPCRATTRHTPCFRCDSGWRPARSRADRLRAAAICSARTATCAMC